MRPGVAFALVLFVVVGKADRAKGDVCRVRSEQVPNLRQIGRPPMCYAVFALLVAAVEDDHDRRVGLPLLERLAEQTLPVCREGRRVRQRHAAAVKLRDSVVVAIDTLGHDRHTRPSRHFRPRFCAEEAAREHSETRRGTRPHLSLSRQFFSLQMTLNVPLPMIGRARRASSTALVGVFNAAHPGDVAALSDWLEQLPAGARLRAVLGKTEGNGCVNDFTRAYASEAVRAAIASAPNHGHAAAAAASVVMSGGTEGVLSPHLIAFADVAAPPGVSGGLAIGVARTRELHPEEIGTSAQVVATRTAVEAACADAGLAPSAVRYAQIKCPLLTAERIAAARDARGAVCATDDAYFSMALSRGASALGVAVATGELRGDAAAAALADSSVIARDFRLESAVAAASAGVELMCSEVMVLGEREAAPGESGGDGALRAATAVMADALDVPSVLESLEARGLRSKHGQLDEDARRRVVAVLAKADPAPSVRGRRTTMATDSDIHATRHARAALGGALAAAFGDARLFVSGGAEHQGPPGGGPVVVIYRG